MSKKVATKEKVPAPSSQSPLFGEHYHYVKKMTAAELVRERASKLPVSLSPHLASLYDVFQVLTRRGAVSPHFTASLGAQLMRVSKSLEFVNPKTYAKAGSIAGKLYKDYKASCMGSPENHDAAAAVKDFLQRNDKDIGLVMQSLADAYLDQQRRAG